MRKKRFVVGGVSVVALAIVAVVALRALYLPQRLEAVPIDLTTRAVVHGIPNARYWVLEDAGPLVRDALAAAARGAYLSQVGPRWRVAAGSARCGRGRRRKGSVTCAGRAYR